LIQWPRAGLVLAMTEDWCDQPWDAEPISAQPMPAVPCRCEHPLVDGDSCLRCGHSPMLLPDPPAQLRARQEVAWTRTGVVRAIKAFAFFRGRAPVLTDWSERKGRDWPALETVEGLFGSLDAAIRAADVERSGSHASSLLASDSRVSGTPLLVADGAAGLALRPATPERPARIPPAGGPRRA
jgi:hypothetical protein